MVCPAPLWTPMELPTENQKHAVHGNVYRQIGINEGGVETWNRTEAFCLLDHELLFDGAV